MSTRSSVSPRLHRPISPLSVLGLRALGLALLIMTSGCLTTYWRPFTRQLHFNADAELEPMNPVQPSSWLIVTSSGRYNVGGLNPELNSTRGFEGAAGSGFPLPSANRFSLLGTLAGRKFAIGDSSRPHLVADLLSPNKQVETNIHFLINDNAMQDNTGGIFLSLTEFKADAGSLPAVTEQRLQTFKVFVRIIDPVEPKVLASAVESEPRELRVVTVGSGFQPLLIKSLSFDSIELRAGDLVARISGSFSTPDDAAIADGGLLSWTLEVSIPNVGVVRCKSTTFLATAGARLGVYNFKNEPVEWNFPGKAPTASDPFLRIAGISALECNEPRLDKLHVDLELSGRLVK
jgi:hypothetical protein